MACASGEEPQIATGYQAPVPTADDPVGEDAGDDNAPSPPSDGNPDDGVGDGPVTFLGCCARHEEPGCQDPDVAACVCKANESCCTDEWTQDCVVEGVARGCMECSNPGDGGDEEENDEDAEGDGIGTDGSADDGTGGGTPGNDCCSVSAEAGCSNTTVQDCVCAVDAFCCDNEWDEACVIAVDEESCGMCGNGESGGDAAGDDGAMQPDGVCCEAQDTPGCFNDTLEVCVCNEDDFCCDFAWDEFCVDLITSSNCGVC
ncbi:MAG: hypothetical protein AAF721_37635 [Myxococcota bacterium]